MKIELSHDTLAKSIFDRFSEEDKMRVQIRQLLMERLVDYKDHRTLLSKEDLNYMDSYIDSIELNRDALNLVRTSKEKIQQRKKSIRIAVITSIGLLVVFLSRNPLTSRLPLICAMARAVFCMTLVKFGSPPRSINI